MHIQYLSTPALAMLGTQAGFVVVCVCSLIDLSLARRTMQSSA